MEHKKIEQLERQLIELKKHIKKQRENEVDYEKENIKPLQNENHQDLSSIQ